MGIEFDGKGVLEQLFLARMGDDSEIFVPFTKRGISVFEAMAIMIEIAAIAGKEMENDHE